MWELASARRVPLLIEDYESESEDEIYFDDVFTLTDNPDLIYGELSTKAFGRLVTCFNKPIFVDVGCGRGLSIRAVSEASKHKIWCWGMDLVQRRLVNTELDVVVADARHCTSWLIEDAVIFINWLAFCESTRNALLQMLISTKLQRSVILTVGWSLPDGPFRLIGTTPLRASWGSTCCVFSHVFFREFDHISIGQHTIPIAIADAADEMLEAGIFGDNSFQYLPNYSTPCPRINDTLDVLRYKAQTENRVDDGEDVTTKSCCSYTSSRKHGLQQRLITCLTCCPDGCFAVCTFCAENCHSGHTLLTSRQASSPSTSDSSSSSSSSWRRQQNKKNKDNAAATILPLSFCDCGFATRCFEKE